MKCSIEITGDVFSRGTLGDDACKEAARMVELYGFALIEGAFSTAMIEALAVSLRSTCGQYKFTEESSDTVLVGAKRFMTTVSLEPPFDDPQVYANPFVYPVLLSLLGRRMILSSFGAVVALPGAPIQHVHCDHSHLFMGHEAELILPPYAITVIVPLIQLDPSTGTTMMWVGSHRAAQGMRKYLQAVQPFPRIGGVIIMDGRMIHAGTANDSNRARPVLYCEYARPWFRDTKNYDAMAPLKGPPGFFASIPARYNSLFAHGGYSRK